MKSSRILTIVGVSVVVLLIGIALGSVAFPMTTTETSTDTITSTITLISSVTLNEIETVTQKSYIVIYSGSNSETLTEEILVESVEHIQVFTSGNCTAPAGTAYVVANVTTTEYRLPSQLTNLTANPQIVTATLTTVSSYVAGVDSTDFTTVSFNIHSFGNATVVFLSTRTNGTMTSIVTATCPLFV